MIRLRPISWLARISMGLTIRNCQRGSSVPSADAITAATRAFGGFELLLSHHRIPLAGVVTLSEIGPIWTINQQAKSLKSLASTLAVVGKFRSV